jgi:hypothetical protein
MSFDDSHLTVVFQRETKISINSMKAHTSFNIYPWKDLERVLQFLVSTGRGDLVGIVLNMGCNPDFGAYLKPGGQD